MAIDALQPQGPATHLTAAIQSVLSDLQGQRLAAVVVLTDGRQTPAPPQSADIEAIKSFGVKIDPVAVGTDQAPRNIAVESMDLEDAAFVGDIVNVKGTVRADGYPKGVPVRFELLNHATGEPLKSDDGQPVARTISLAPEQTQTLELQFKPDHVGPLDVELRATPQPGELDEADNTRLARVDVLDATINVLYVDGYPRWDYRYLKTQMIRDRTVNISCLLLGADADFAQEGDPPTKDFPGPITRFPDSLSELLKYDVVLIGDVDPRQFTDTQLQMLSDFVSQKGGGFEMIAGEVDSPHAWRGTPVEAMLPVKIGDGGQGLGIRGKEENLNPNPSSLNPSSGFRPLLTPAGKDSGIFRFFADPKANQKYIETTLPALFWYCHGISVKPGVGQALAEHPIDLGPDGKKAPLLVAGRFGAGRTLFCAFEGSWRWRFYTGESVFDTFWVQQIRYLARGRKLGQRRFIFAADHPIHELGQRVHLNLRVLDPDLLKQLSPDLPMQILDPQGQPAATPSLHRQGNSPDQYTAAFTADRPGSFTARLKLPDGATADLPLRIITPRLELLKPQVDTALLARLANQTGGELIPFPQAAEKIAAIPSAQKIIPLSLAHPLWDSPLVLILLASVITAEWITRKLGGMV
jgi:uncharacterized membrane protein